MRVDPACVAFPCLIACAAAIDDAIQIQPKVMDTRWKESARLWGVLVGHPGVGKSPALNKAIEPCRSRVPWGGSRTAFPEKDAG